MVRTGGRPLVVAGAVGLAVLAVGGPASAHNALTSSEPEHGERMESGPAEIPLTFLATVDPDAAELSVTGPAGESAVAGEPAG